MLINRVLGSLIFLLLSLSAFSQMEYSRATLWQAQRFYQNGEAIKGKNIESILKKSPTAHAEFLKGKRKSRLGQICSILGIGSWLYGGLNTLKDGQTNNLGYDLGLAGGAVLTYYFIRKEAEHYQKASILYNNDMGNETTDVSIKPTITQNGIGVLVNF